MGLFFRVQCSGHVANTQSDCNSRLFLEREEMESRLTIDDPLYTELHWIINLLKTFIKFRSKKTDQVNGIS